MTNMTLRFAVAIAVETKVAKKNVQANIKQ